MGPAHVKGFVGRFNEVIGKKARCATQNSAGQSRASAEPHPRHIHNTNCRQTAKRPEHEHADKRTTASPEEDRYDGLHDIAPLENFFLT
jgi:hypothetical protein